MSTCRNESGHISIITYIFFLHKTDSKLIKGLKEKPETARKQHRQNLPVVQEELSEQGFIHSGIEANK